MSRDAIHSGDRSDRASVGPLILDAPEWVTQAVCASIDPELFFPEKGGSTRDAKRICRSCPVQSDCLDYALANVERYGIWGGVSERDRRKLWDALLVNEADTGETDFGDGDDFYTDDPMGQTA